MKSSVYGDLAVQPCGTRGVGVFAKRVFHKGDILLPVTGKKAKGRGEYTIQIDDTVHIEPDEQIGRAHV